VAVIVRSRRVILPDGERPASLHIDRETIVAIGAYGDAPAGANVLDAGDLVVSPGIVDTHVHINEPGRTEWEGFDTATRAAAAGGVTTIVDMPLNSVPATTSVGGLDAKRAAARRQCHVDVGFWGGVVPGNHGELDALVDAGVRGFKCFLVPSGVDEFPAVDEADLRRALPVLARREVPLLVHAESPRVIDDVAGALPAP
jgi:allantoinase